MQAHLRLPTVCLQFALAYHTLEFLPSSMINGIERQDPDIHPVMRIHVHAVQR